MKCAFILPMLFSVGALSAQTDPKKPDMNIGRKPDTTLTERQTSVRSLQKSDAIKTQDHPKSTPRDSMRIKRR